MNPFTDLAVDLGTKNIRIVSSSNEIIINEPSLVAMKNTQVVAVGKAIELLSEDERVDIEIYSPILDGTIADIPSAKLLIQHFIKKAMSKYNLMKPKIVVAIPYGITKTQKIIIKEVFLQNGARKCFLIEQPMASALGSDIDIKSTDSNLVVDIGASSARIYLISLGGLVLCKTISKDNFLIGLKEVMQKMNTKDKDDIKKNGIILTGGGALQQNITSEIENELYISVKITNNPEHTVILGCREILKEINLLDKLFIEENK